MIVCNCCGKALHNLGAVCSRCSGRGVERPTPLKSFLTPSQQRGSPDRWARNYTTPPGAAPSRQRGSPLSTAPTFDIPLDHDSGALARVYGSVLDPKVVHPLCVCCSSDIKPGNKIYLAPRAGLGCAKDQVLCRACFSDRFSLGGCDNCSAPVLGEREEGGSHVKGRAGVVWHAKCFVCQSCSAPLYKQDHILLPNGNPSCLDCTNMLDEGAEAAAPKSTYARPSILTPTRSLPTFPLTVPPISPASIQTKRQAMADLARLTTVTPVPNRRAGLGGMSACPGCGVKVAFLEKGSTRGPREVLWHAKCLRCGLGRGGFGCGKPVDAGAILGDDDVVLCRACSLHKGSHRYPRPSVAF